jgi:hypothetical protein
VTPPAAPAEPPPPAEVERHTAAEWAALKKTPAPFLLVACARKGWRAGTRGALTQLAEADFDAAIDAAKSQEFR